MSRDNDDDIYEDSGSGSQESENNIENDTDDAPRRKVGFFVGLFNTLEDFSTSAFKNKKAEKKEKEAEKKEKKKKLKKSETTLRDIHKQRKSAFRKVLQRLLLFGFIIMIITAAVIVATQQNQKQDRTKMDVGSFLNDTTSFGSIDKKDYFLEQNVLDDKINIVEADAKEGRKNLGKQIKEQTKIITDAIDGKITELSVLQNEERQEFKKDILSSQDKLLNSVNDKLDEEGKKTKALSKKIDKYKNAPRLTLSNGKVIFPTKNANIVAPVSFSTAPNLNETSVMNENSTEKSMEENKYELVEIDLSGTVVEELVFDTGLNPNDTEQKKKIEFDLTTTLVRVTLIDGIKAPALGTGEQNPTPVLMSIDGISYAANDNTAITLKGCMLQGVAIGNINTSRAEIFGTHLSCIIEGDSGDKYKVEHTFPNNSVWIKGEDGADGVSGLIVDSSGKILAKSAAIGFMQGLTNYFSAQNLVTSGLGTLNPTTTTLSVAQLGTSMQSGVGTGMSTGFDLIIQKYEELLQGYYPFIDVKGGRKNLTAVFGGGVKLIGTPYIEALPENF